MKVIFFGDVVGKAGRQGVAKILPRLKEQHQPDLVIANVENLAHGRGVTLSTLSFMIEAGVDFFTSGNHVFDKPEVREVFQKFENKILRPANWEGNFLGGGWKILEVKGQLVMIINLLGQVFMTEQIDEGVITNPFSKLDEILGAGGEKAKIRILDFHAEATSEKRGMGFWADGKVSAMLGTHTHVPSADAQILSKGTGYVTDVGMCGSGDSVIGVDTTSALNRFKAGEESLEKPPLVVAETGKFEVGYAVLEIDGQTGKCQNIGSFREVF